MADTLVSLNIDDECPQLPTFTPTCWDKFRHGVERTLKLKCVKYFFGAIQIAQIVETGIRFLLNYLYYFPPIATVLNDWMDNFPSTNEEERLQFWYTTEAVLMKVGSVLTFFTFVHLVLKVLQKNPKRWLFQWRFYKVLLSVASVIITLLLLLIGDKFYVLKSIIWEAVQKIKSIYRYTNLIFSIYNGIVLAFDMPDWWQLRQTKVASFKSHIVTSN